MIQKCVFGRSGLNTSVFEKHFISYSCILFIKYYALRSFCIKLLCLSKFLIDRVWFSINRKIPDFSSPASAWLDWYLIGFQPIETKNFLVFKYLTNLFFLRHLCLGFTCIALFYVSILQFCSHISHCFHT